MRSELPTLQMLRAVAALMVCGYHVSQWTQVDFRIGQAGVDLFFVISGAVMWLSAVERDAPPGEFLARRALRIVPAYWVATAACVAVALGLPGLMIHLKPEPWHVALSLAFIPHLDPEGQPFPLLAQGWSLVYEAGFYLLVAVSLFAPRAWRPAIVLGTLTAVAGYGLTNAAAYWLGANLFLMQFAGGCMLGWAYVKRSLASPTMGWAMLIIGLGIFAGYHFTGYHNELWRPVLWGAPAVIVIAGALSIEGMRAPPRVPLLERVGDASYSLYLFHTLVIALLTLAVPPRNIWFAPLAFAAALLVAFVGYRLIEAPFQSLGRRLKGSHAGAVRLSTAP